jgi:hypothetical protein
MHRPAPKTNWSKAKLAVTIFAFLVITGIVACGSKTSASPAESPTPKPTDPGNSRLGRNTDPDTNPRRHTLYKRRNQALP